MKILRRTFTARTATGDERSTLNLDALTSEYYPSHRYLVRVPINTPQRWVNYTFPTKAKANEFIAKQEA